MPNVITATLLSAAVLAGFLGSAAAVPQAVPAAYASEPTACASNAVTLPNPEGGEPDCAKCPTGMVTTVMPPPHRGILCQEPDHRIARNPGVGLSYDNRTVSLGQASGAGQR